MPAQFLCLFLTLLLSPSLVSCVDLTLVSKTHGPDVVQAAIDKLDQSLAFPSDHSFLSRLAYIESLLGDDPSTYPPTFFGGIWQVTEFQYLETKNSAAYPYLLDLHQNILTSFNINWSSTKWRDLQKPMYSLLASRLFITIVLNQKNIPDILVDQASLWYYNISSGSPFSPSAASVDDFVNEVSAWEEETKCTNAKVKVVVVMDGSGSIGQSDFEKALEFAALFFSAYNLTQTQMGFMTYSTQQEVILELDNSLTEDEIQEAVLNAAYAGDNTGTGDALLEAVQMFLRSSVRPGVPLLLITFTDGQSNTGSPVQDGVDEAMALGIDSYAVGITDAINLPELVQIAYDDPTKVEVLTQYDALTSFFHELNQITCKVEQSPTLNTPTQDDLMGGQKRYYNFEAPPGGKLEIKLEAMEGQVMGYYSHKYKNPSAALYDGVLWEGENEVSGSGVVHVTVQGMAEGFNDYVIEASV